jgi:hypothetical protein
MNGLGFSAKTITGEFRAVSCNPPASVFPLVPPARLRPLSAKRIWSVVSLVFLALSLGVLHQSDFPERASRILISLSCVLPLRVDFLYARPYGFVLLLICTAYYAACRIGPAEQCVRLPH